MLSPAKQFICYGCRVTFRNLGTLGEHARTSDTCTVEMRFWGKVDKSAGPEACWPWTAAITTHGYGCVTWHGRTLGAHKVAYMLIKGEVPTGLQIMHACDNPVCCNPLHLSTGTKKENMADMYRKGRGRKSGKRKLNLAKALEIRGLHGKASSGEVAKQYGITQSYVFGIWAGRVWRTE